MSFDARTFRNALGCYPTGVAVVTAQPEGAAPLGLTINSFASVSLDPPLVLWSIDRRSECLGAFNRAPAFVINILTNAQQDLSARLSRKEGHGLEGIGLTQAVTGTPIIAGSHAWFDCAVWARHDGGDHVIMIGEVKALGQDDAAPLLYYRGAYRSLADAEPGA